LKPTAAFAAILCLAAAIGAWMTATGGFSDAAEVRAGPDSSAVVGTISLGEPVELEAFARADGRTVFFFTKPWCGACWRLAPRVEEAVRAAGDATLRVVDIRSWESGVAQQHGIRATPHLVLYEDGKHTASGIDAVLRAFR
jgi:thiol-disulfide isomerase/thioredoxin